MQYLEERSVYTKSTKERYRCPFSLCIKQHLNSRNRIIRGAISLQFLIHVCKQEAVEVMEGNHIIYSNILDLIKIVQARLMVHTKLTNLTVMNDSSSANPIKKV